jgi:hypothetical protein
MVNKVRLSSNYSTNDETEREQRRDNDSGHPLRNMLAYSRTLQTELQQ